MNEFNPMIHKSILSYMKDHSCDFELLPSGFFRLRVPMDACIPEASILISAMDSGLSVQGIVPVRIPADKLNDVYSFINRVNTSLPMGSFVYYAEHKQLRYKYYCDCNYCYSPPEAVIKKAVFHVSSVMEEQLFGICTLLFGKSPTESPGSGTKPLLESCSSYGTGPDTHGQSEESSKATHDEYELSFEDILSMFGLERDGEQFHE